MRAALLAAEDESTHRQAANRFVRCVLAGAAQAGQVKEMKTEQTNKIPVYRRLADEIKAEILSGKRAPGSMLPSERLMAQQLGVHRNTVAKAYNELEAEELIDARQGVGYLVHAADAARSAKTGQNRSSIARKEPKKKKVNWKARIKVNIRIWRSPSMICFSDSAIKQSSPWQRYRQPRNLRQRRTGTRTFFADRGRG